MKLLGFNFKKISIEKISTIDQPPKIESSINVSNIKKIESKLFDSKETPLEISFIYDLNYTPDFAKLSFTGNLIILFENKEAKEILKKWDDKNLSNEFKTSIFNIILRKTNLKALQLEDELNLPLHVQMPSIKINDSNKKDN